jgi:UDP-N-acetylmuramoylalanine--D-glutamate ligase
MAETVTELRGKRVALVGMGKESAALARFAAREGALAIVACDMRPADQLAAVMDEVADLDPPVRLIAGSNDPSAWEDADVIFASPGITPGFEIKIPGIAEAAARGATISNHTQLLFERCPAPILGITGSAGKTTTTTLVADILAQQGGRRVWLGGNMGVPLINSVPTMTPDDIVVLEISEVQLARLHASPHVGVITNITPDHFDRYGTFERYVQAKRQMVRDMRPDDFAVLNADNGPSRDSAAETMGQVLLFSRTQPIDAGADVRDGAFWLRLPGRPPQRVCATGEATLPGAHNVENILAACLAAALAGASSDAMAASVRTFRGVAHRIEFVGEWRGVRFYDDSIATAPTRALAALRSFDVPILLVAGGKDKNLPWGEFADAIVRRVRVAAIIGVSAPKILDAIGAAHERAPVGEQIIERVERVATMEDAVGLLAGEARQGEVVLLSPGCASHDMFSGFEERGQRFADAVRALAQ